MQGGCSRSAQLRARLLDMGTTDVRVAGAFLLRSGGQWWCAAPVSLLAFASRACQVGLANQKSLSVPPRTCAAPSGGAGVPCPRPPPAGCAPPCRRGGKHNRWLGPIQAASACTRLVQATTLQSPIGLNWGHTALPPALCSPASCTNPARPMQPRAHLRPAELCRRAVQQAVEAAARAELCHQRQRRHSAHRD